MFYTLIKMNLARKLSRRRSKLLDLAEDNRAYCMQYHKRLSEEDVRKHQCYRREKNLYRCQHIVILEERKV